MRTNEKVRQHVVFLAALPPITHKRFTGQEQRRAGQFHHSQPKVLNNLIQRFYRRKRQRQFGVDDRVDR